jgi:hypothetical protein
MDQMTRFRTVLLTLSLLLMLAPSAWSQRFGGGARGWAPGFGFQSPVVAPRAVGFYSGYGYSPYVGYDPYGYGYYNGFGYYNSYYGGWTPYGGYVPPQMTTNAMGPLMDTIVNTTGRRTSWGWGW